MTFKGNTIQRKLVKTVLLISGAVLLLASTTILSYEFVTFRQTTLQQAATIGEIIAANSTAALAFENPDDAKEILSALKAELPVVGAGLYDKDGKLFSHGYSQDNQPRMWPTKPVDNFRKFQAGKYVLFKPVFCKDERVGTLYLESDLSELDTRLSRYGGIVVVVLFASVLVSLVLSSKLQGVISKPVLHLANALYIHLLLLRK